MVNVKINGIDISVKEGTTILDAAAELGIKIPTLCYLKDYNEIGACRMCVVDIKGFDHLQASCNTVCAEGMEIETFIHGAMCISSILMTSPSESVLTLYMHSGCFWLNRS